MPLHLATRDASPRKGFTLTELLVAVAIILVLMSLIGGAVSAARGSQKKQATQTLISKIDAIVQQHYASFYSRSVPSSSSASDFGTMLRRIVTAEMPDRWTDVKYMAANASQFTSPIPRSYIAVWNALSPEKRLTPGDDGYNPAPSPTDAEKAAYGAKWVCYQYSGAECLFMSVMRGGIADCLDCGSLTTSQIGDKDGDGMPEFWDAWGNPIALILWPAALELPAGSGTRFFSQTAPFTSGASGRLMRPLIYSAGPDGDYGYDRGGDVSYLNSANCGEPSIEPMKSCGTPSSGAPDNVTNLDDEAKR